MKNNRLESIITQSLERFYSRLMPILNSKQPKESGKGLTKNDLTDELKGKYDEAVNMSHGHANKNILDNTNASFTTTLKGNYDDAVNKSHTHSNKNILDKTTESFTTDIKTQINTNKSNISIVADYINDSDLITDSESKMVKTVPTNANHACGISMIGGKTVKSKNLLKPQNGLKEATVNGITFTPVFDSNGHLEYVTANGTATANASFIVTKLTEDISGYILSLGLSQESVSYGVACELAIPPWTTYQTIKGSGEKTVPSITYTDTINVYVQVLKDAVANNVKFYPMLRKSGTSGIYEPYHEELWNAPVESVVSVGKNLCSGLKYGKGINTTYGTEYDLANAACTDFIPVKPSTTIYASGMGTVAANFIAWYDVSKNYIDRSGGSNNNLRSQALPANARYVRLNWYGGVTLDMATNNTIMISYDNSAFIPYNKTTLLIPDSIKNLPDYGVEGNVVDFENMVYHHARVKENTDNISFSSYSTLFGWSITIEEARRLKVKPVSSNSDISSIISDKYETVHLEANNHMTVNNSIGVNISGQIFVNNGDSSNKPTGTIVYELATEELIDISDILHPIRCETGGTITLQNEHNLDIPNTVIYKKEVSLS